MSKNSLELKDSINQAVTECRSIVDTCKGEKRSMTEEEEKRFNELKSQIETEKEQLSNLEAELREYDNKIKDLEQREIKTDKNNKSHNMKNTLVKELRNALDNNVKTISINASTETRAVQVTGEGGVHDQVVETEIQGILEPLYANSVLAKLGVKFYPGLPQGDIQIPIMGKGTVGWAGEVAAASASSNEFTTVLMQPKRLTAYVDISKQLIYQDTIGVEAAIRRDIVNALNDKLEATILGAAAGTATQPAGIFYNVSPTTTDTFAKICQLEATVENANVYGQMKYLLSTGAKAELRSMAKSSKNTQLVYEGGEVDGVPAITTSNVANNKFIYGDFSNLAVASWGNIDITIDEYTQAVNGCVRLVINAYFDAKVLRSAAFAFGQTSVVNG